MNSPLQINEGGIHAAPSSSTSLVHFGVQLEACIRAITEIPAAILVAAEAILLFVNVFYRYVLNQPLIWGDELAGLLFIWLAMLGTVIALQRGEHMRLTTFLAKMSPTRRAFFETFGNVIVTTFVLLMLFPTWQYVIEEWEITTPALELPHSFRVASIATGFTLMLAISVSRLMERAQKRDFSISAVVAAGIAVLLMLGKPILLMLGNVNLILFFALGVTFMVMIGVPIMTAFAFATLSYLASVKAIPLIVVVSRMDEGMSAPILLSVPLFVFLGALIEAMGMAEAMIRFLSTLVGHFRGGLSYVLIGAMYLISGISGSKSADMAAVAPALFPEMKKRGEDEAELVAMLCASGAMSETIPPSLVLITIGSVTGVSIAALFTGGFMPAIVGAVAMAIIIWAKNRNKNAGSGRRATTAEIGKAFMLSLPALALPFLIRTAVVEGIATATEVAAIGVAYTFIIGLTLYKKFRWKRLYPILVDSASLSGSILIIIGSATAMAWALTQSGFSKQLADLMTGLPGGKVSFMIVSVFAFVFLGSFLEGIPAIVLFGPLLFPIAHSAGIHEVHYAMVAVFAMGLGLFAPPFGVGFYAACAIGRVNPDLAIKRVWPYLAALFVALLLIAAFPWISIGFL